MQRCFRVGVAVGMAVLVGQGWGQAAAHAPDGGTVERIQPLVVLPKTGAPFTAVVVTDWTRLLEDGSTTTIKNHRVVARDGEGRIFQERRFFSPTGDKDETRLRALEYVDPVKHEFTNCVTATKVCTVYPYHRAASVVESLPASETLPNGMGTVTRESLGTQTMEGLETVGSRQITTINPGANGYQHAEPTIKEFWYSPQLEVNVVTKRFEPRGGAQNFNMEQVSTEEPKAELFVLPKGYVVIHSEEPEQ